MHVINKLVILFLALFPFAIASGQELIVKFREPTDISPPGKQAGRFFSSSPLLDQLLATHPPREISTLFKADTGRMASLPASLNYIQKWRFDSANSALAAISALTALPGVVYAEANHRYTVNFAPADPYLGEQWYLEAIGASAAWDIEPGDEEVIVGVIDTGVDYFHEDLAGRIWINSVEDLNGNSIPDSADFNGIDDDGNGYIDDVVGWDFTDAPDFPDQGDFQEPDADPMDEFGASGHGTPISGIIAAERNNDIGIAGIAPGVRIMALRAGTASGFLEEDDVAEAAIYAIHNGCRIVNMSFGDVAFSYLLRDVIRYGTESGLIFVAASGNSGSSAPFYPAGLDETISVGSTNRENFLSGFSNFGPTLSLVAPGEDLFSTWPDNAYGPTTGTSFAAPVVSAALALIWSQNPQLSAEQARGALLASAKDLGFAGWDSNYGHGLVNLPAALTAGLSGYAQIETPASGTGLAASEALVSGSAFGPAMDGYDLSYGVGTNPLQWVTITEGPAVQVINDTLAVWDISTLADTTYTLRLRVQQSGMADVVHTTLVYIDHSPADLLSIAITPLIDATDAATLIEFVTDDLVTATLFVRLQGTGPFVAAKEVSFLRNEQHFILTSADFPGELDAYITLANAAGLQTIIDNDGNYYRLELTPAAPLQSILSPVATWPFSAYMMYRFTDFDRDDSPEIVISELVDDNQFGPLKIKEFADGAFSDKLVTEFPIIPRDAGSLGSGADGLICGFGSNSILLGSGTSGGFPTAILWDDTTNFWVSRFGNFDGDAENEVLGLNFGRWRIYDIGTDNTLLEAQTMPVHSEGSNIFGVPWSVYGDFDGDGRRDIVLLDNEGDLIVYEAGIDGLYQPVWTMPLPGNGGNSLLTAADIDGDGSEEFVSAVRHEPAVITESNINTRYWVLQVWQAAGDNSYAQIAGENFLGATVQTGIHNGLNSADIDGDGRDEILLTPFPDAYVLGVDENGIELLWYTPNVNSNTILPGDIDRDGRVDLLINSDDGLLQFEVLDNANQPLPPVQLVATALDTNRISLHWSGIPGADYYRIYRHSDGVFALLDSTDQPEYFDGNLLENTLYTYAVTQINTAFPLVESLRSASASARPNRPPHTESVMTLSNERLQVSFSEPMSDGAFTAAAYRLPGTDTGIASAARSENRRNAILTLTSPLEQGEHVLRLLHLTDLDNTPMRGDSIDIPFTASADPAAFYPEWVEFVNRRQLKLHFNRPVSVESGTNPANYRMEPDGLIVDAALDSTDLRTVHLFTDGENRMGSLGVPYYIIVENIEGSQGEQLSAANANRLLVRTIVSSLDNVIVYPNPYRADFTSQPLMFANLPFGSEVFIYNASGTFIKKLENESSFGGVSWNLHTKDNDFVATGVYIYIIRYDGDEQTGKILLVR